MRQRRKNLAGPPTGLRNTQRKAAQPMLLGRFAGRAGREVDDLAAQLFRSPLFVGQRKICRNVKLNHFRHHILLAGHRTPHSSVLKEPPEKSEFAQAHISLTFCISSSSKLSATYRNTETTREFSANLREKAQVSLSNVRFGANNLHLSPAPCPSVGSGGPRMGNTN